MPLQATSGAASYDAFGGGAAAVPTYIEDVFSTWLYTGNSTSGGTQTITNNIDLSTKGGMVWIKGRSAASNNILTDTSRGAGTSASNNQALSSNLSTAEDLAASYDFLSAFNTTGFAVTQGGTTAATRGTNYNAVTYASWTFRKQPKFFDVVTWTGNGSSPRNITHNLGSVPACIITKCTSTSGTDWFTYHASLGNRASLSLEQTTAQEINTGIWGSTTPTSTVFTVGNVNVNTNGSTYVAYLFAHDAGGFGLTGTDNVISCGSYVKDGSGNATVNLGYEPQWIIAKPTSTTGRWYMYDNMRGMSMTAGALLSANYSNAESSYLVFNPTATGFKDVMGSDAGETYIYIAIRRGPMKVPTDATKVFSPNVETTGANPQTLTTGFPVDLVINTLRTTQSKYFNDRLRGSSTASMIDLKSNTPTAESASTGVGIGLTNNTGIVDSGWWNSTDAVFWNFGRAPSFFDEVCYTGTGSNTTFSHNLSVVPELIIVKRRDAEAAWDTYCSAFANTEYIVLNTTAAKATGATRWNSTTPTSSVFSVGTSTTTNASAGTYVAYLFATCAGVSKVGSYTGTGTTKQIDCGFTGGARFVLIKRTDSTGDWYVWDTARGIVSGNDPYLLLNSTAAEVTNTDYVDTYSAGFEISSTAPAAINASGGTFIFLAIA